MEAQPDGLVGLKCPGCNKLFMPPRYLCSECGSSELQPVALSGKGEVYTFTTIRVAPVEFENEVPYIVALIKLEEGLRITARLTVAEGEQLEIGTPVRFDKKEKTALWFEVVT